MCTTATAIQCRVCANIYILYIHVRVNAVQCIQGEREWESEREREREREKSER